MGLYRSDAYQVYAGWFPPERHVVGKGGVVNWNEGLHSEWRGKLNRLMRRTKGYTKSLEMLVYSLALVCWHWHPNLISPYVENTHESPASAVTPVPAVASAPSPVRRLGLRQR